MNQFKLFAFITASVMYLAGCISLPTLTPTPTAEAEPASAPVAATPAPASPAAPASAASAAKAAPTNPANAASAASSSPLPRTPLVGSDRDAHGCIGSAGYSWCERTQQCERPWKLAAANAFELSKASFDKFCKPK